MTSPNRTPWLLGVVVAALAGCASPKATPDSASATKEEAPMTTTRERPAVKTSATAASVLDSMAGNGERSVAVSVGIPDWRTGRVTLQVAGDGTVRVDQRSSTGDNVYTAKWAPERVASFARDLREARILDIAPVPGPREPGDVPVEIVVTDGSNVAHHVSVWHADRYDDPHLDQVLKAVDGAVGEISGGALP